MPALGRSNSSVSVAKPQDLTSAGSDYPAWVLMKYTQLPAEVPRHVRYLGARLTGRAETPYDKAKAIEEHLASLHYNLKIQPTLGCGFGCLCCLVFSVGGPYDTI